MSDPLGLLPDIGTGGADPLGLLPNKNAASEPDKPDTRTTGQKIARAVGPYARPVLEYGGMTAGGMAGGAAGAAVAGVGAVGGAVLGGGTGYAVGKTLADEMDEYAGLKDRKSLKETAQAAVDALQSGVGMAAIGEAGGAGLKGALKAIAESKFPERLYASAAKMPLSKKWIQLLSGEDFSARVRAIKQGLEDKIPVSEHGVEKARVGTKTSGAKISATEATISEPVSTDQILNDGLKRAYEKAANSEDPIGQKATVDQWKETFKSGHGDEVTGAKAGDVKRELYKHINWNDPAAKEIVQSSRRGVANALKTKLEELEPSLHNMNQKNAAYQGLTEALEKAVSRYGNSDIAGLGAKVLAVKNIPLAVLSQILGLPYVKSKLAIALSQAGSKPTSALIKSALGYGMGKAKESKSALQIAPAE